MNNTVLKLGVFFFKNRSFIPLFFFIICPFFIEQGYIKVEKIFLISFSFCFIGSLIRFLTVGYSFEGTSGRNRVNQVAEQLNTKGMYSICRNPLYVGNLFVWIGLAIFTHSIIFINIVLISFLVFYYPIVFVEEKFLKEKFGESYITWKNKVPRFQFAFWLFKNPTINFNFKKCIRNEYSGIISISCSYLFIYTLKNISKSPFVFDSFYVFFVAIIILCLFIRYCKKNTSLLN